MARGKKAHATDHEVVERLKLSTDLMAKINSVKDSYNFTEKTFVEMVVKPREASEEENARAHILLMLSALHELFGYQPPDDIAKIIGRDLWSRLRNARNETGHQYCNIPGKPPFDYRKAWEFVRDDIPRIIESVEQEILRREKEILEPETNVIAASAYP